MVYRLDTSDKEAFVRLIKPDVVVTITRVIEWVRVKDDDRTGPCVKYAYSAPEPDSNREWTYVERVPHVPHEFFVDEFVSGDESKTLYAELCERKQKIKRARHSGSAW